MAQRHIVRLSTGCGFDPPLEEMKYLFKVEFSLKVGRTECLNTRFPLYTLLCARYSVKLIYLFIYILIFQIMTTKPTTTANNVFFFELFLFHRFRKKNRRVEYRYPTYNMSNSGGSRNTECLDTRFSLSILRIWDKS